MKAASDIYSPLAGTVSAVNDRLSDEAHLLNKSPEKDGELNHCSGGRLCIELS